MQAQTRTAPARLAAPGHGLLAWFLGRIIDADQQYRDRQRLRAMPDDRRADMGLTRADLRRVCGRGIHRTERPHDPGMGW